MDISTPPAQIEDRSYYEYKNENIDFEQSWITDTIENFKESLKNIKSIEKQDIAKLPVFQKTIVLQEKNKQLPEVIFVSDIKQKTRVNTYANLPKLQLTNNEETCVKEQEKITQHNGDHLLLSTYDFDSFSNKIYLEAKQATYAQLQCLRKGEIKNDYTYYQTGVISPLICNDKKILFLQRNDHYKLWSSPAGYLQPINGQIGGDELNLIKTTAMKEVEEEILPDKLINSVSTNSNLSLSIRFILTFKLPVAEFIMPVYVNYSCDQLKTIIETENAKDKSEHIANQYWNFDFSSKESLASSIKEFSSFPKRGWFLYWPVIQTLFPEESKNIEIPSTVLFNLI